MLYRLCEGRLPLFYRGGQTADLAVRFTAVYGSVAKAIQSQNAVAHSRQRAFDQHMWGRADGRVRFNRNELKPGADREQSPLE
jgi:hypothetical protein